MYYEQLFQTNPQQSELPLRAQWGQLVQELERRQRQ